MREWIAACRQDGAVGLWVLDGPGPYYDHSRNGQTLTRENSPVSVPGLLTPPGARLRGVRLVPASSQSLTLTSYISDSTGMGMECYARTTSTDATSSYSGNAALSLHGDATGNFQHAFGVHGGKLRFARYVAGGGDGWERFDGATTVNDGRWHQFAANYNSTSKLGQVIVDGVVDGSLTFSSHRAFGGFSRIGANNIGGGTAGDWWDGDIALAAIFADDLAVARYAVHHNALRRSANLRARAAA